MHKHDIADGAYRLDKLLLAIDTELCWMCHLTGFNIRVCGLMTVVYKYNSDGGANAPI